MRAGFRHRLAFVVFVTIGVSPAMASAATITVTDLTDDIVVDGMCSIREAVAVANSDAGTADCPRAGVAGADTIVLPADTIVFDTPGDDNTNVGGDLDITDTVTFQGAGVDSTAIVAYDASEADGSVFHVLGGGHLLTLADLTTSKDTSTGVFGRRAVRSLSDVILQRVTVAHFLTGSGGAVWGDGAVTVEDSLLDDNWAAVDGAAILGAHVVIQNSTLRQNTVGFASAVAGVVHATDVDVAGSLFTGNTAGAANAIVYHSGTGTFVNSTFSGNTVAALFQDPGGAPVVSSCTFALNDHPPSGVLRNSIVGWSVVPGPCAGITSLGNNLIDDPSCPAGPDDFVGAATLHGLADNGGPTLTHALAPGSLAIDQGTCLDVNDVALELDQRGEPRPAVGPCDIGAFEASSASGGVLVDLTDEPAGVNCAEGGVRVDAGIDDDGDGVLAPDEIESTDYVCDGANGANGALVVVTSEPPGTNCADGGLRIESGVDDDRNGVLEPGEVDSTQYICDGPEGPPGQGGCSAGQGGTGAGFALPLLFALLLLSAMIGGFRRRRTR